MCKKLLLSLLLSLSLFAVSFGVCLANQVPRVAILPVLFRGNAVFDQEVDKIIADALAGKFQPPLSRTIPVYDIIPNAEITAALVHPGDKQKSKLEKSMLADAAIKLNADIVIAAEVTASRTTVIMTWDNDRWRETDLGIHVISYHRPSGNFAEQQDRQLYQGDDIEWGRPEYIARGMITKLLNKMPDYREHPQIVKNNL